MAHRSDRNVRSRRRGGVAIETSDRCPLKKELSHRFHRPEVVSAGNQRSGQRFPPKEVTHLHRSGAFFPVPTTVSAAKSGRRMGYGFKSMAPSGHKVLGSTSVMYSTTAEYRKINKAIWPAAWEKPSPDGHEDPLFESWYVSLEICL